MVYRHRGGQGFLFGARVLGQNVPQAACGSAAVCITCLNCLRIFKGMCWRHVIIHSYEILTAFRDYDLPLLQCCMDEIAVNFTNCRDSKLVS